MIEDTSALYEMVDQGTHVSYWLPPQAREPLPRDWKRWIRPVLWFSSGSFFALLFFVFRAEVVVAFISGVMALVCFLNGVVGVMALVCFLNGVVGVIHKIQETVGYDVLELSSTRIRVSHCLGPFRYSRSVNPLHVDQFAVVRKNRRDQIYYSLHADRADGNSSFLVSHYPQRFLQELAVSLSMEFKNRFAAVDDDFERPLNKLPVRLDTEVRTEVVERPEKPLGLGSSVEHKGDSVILRLSRCTSRETRADGGIMNSALSYLVGFGIGGFVIGGFFLLPLYIGAYGLMSAWRTLVLGEKMVDGNPWAALCFGVFFVLVSCAFFYQAMSSYLLKTSVIVTPSLLVIENRRLNHVKRQEWAREDIEDIRVIIEYHPNSEGADYTQDIHLFPSVSSLNGKPVTLGLGGTRSKPELEWIASTCRRVLGLHSQRHESSS